MTINKKLQAYHESASRIRRQPVAPAPMSQSTGGENPSDIASLSSCRPVEIDRGCNSHFASRLRGDLHPVARGLASLWFACTVRVTRQEMKLQQLVSRLDETFSLSLAASSAAE